MNETAMATPLQVAPTCDEIIGRNVDFLIWRSRETQASVARALGMTPGALSHKLKGRRPWSTTEVQHVATRYGVSIDSLFHIGDAVAESFVLKPRVMIDAVGPEGLEPPASSVKSRELAVVLPFVRRVG